jgi:hypothetical protein
LQLLFFGRPKAAAAGKLFIVSAGPSEPFEKCRSLFAAGGARTDVKWFASSCNGDRSEQSQRD